MGMVGVDGGWGMGNRGWQQVWSRGWGMAAGTGRVWGLGRRGVGGEGDSERGKRTGDRGRV